MLFCTFLCRHCTTTTTWKCPCKFTFFGEREKMNTRQFLWFPFPDFRCSLWEFNSRKNWQHLTNWTRWNKRKFEAAQIHFFEWRFPSGRLRWCLSSVFLVQLFLATTLRLAFESFVYPHPHPILFFHWFISVTGAWFHWSGSSWLEGVGLLAMAHNSSLSRDWLCQKKKPLDIPGTHLH